MIKFNKDYNLKSTLLMLAFFILSNVPVYPSSLSDHFLRTPILFEEENIKMTKKRMLKIFLFQMILEHKKRGKNHRIAKFPSNRKRTKFILTPKALVVSGVILSSAPATTLLYAQTKNIIQIFKQYSIHTTENDFRFKHAIENIEEARVKGKNKDYDDMSKDIAWAISAIEESKLPMDKKEQLLKDVLEYVAFPAVDLLVKDEDYSTLSDFLLWVTMYYSGDFPSVNILIENKKMDVYKKQAISQIKKDIHFPSVSISSLLSKISESKLPHEEKIRHAEEIMQGTIFPIIDSMIAKDEYKGAFYDFTQMVSGLRFPSGAIDDMIEGKMIEIYKKGVLFYVDKEDFYGAREFIKGEIYIGEKRYKISERMFKEGFLEALDLLAKDGKFTQIISLLKWDINNIIPSEFANLKELLKEKKDSIYENAIQHYIDMGKFNDAGSMFGEIYYHLISDSNKSKFIIKMRETIFINIDSMITRGDYENASMLCKAVQNYRLPWDDKSKKMFTKKHQELKERLSLRNSIQSLVSESYLDYDLIRLAFKSENRSIREEAYNLLKNISLKTSYPLGVQKHALNVFKSKIEEYSSENIGEAFHLLEYLELVALTGPNLEIRKEAVDDLYLISLSEEVKTEECRFRAIDYLKTISVKTKERELKEEAISNLTTNIKKQNLSLSQKKKALYNLQEIVTGNSIDIGNDIHSGKGDEDTQLIVIDELYNISSIESGVIKDSIFSFFMDILGDDSLEHLWSETGRALSIYMSSSVEHLKKCAIIWGNNKQDYFVTDIGFRPRDVWYIYRSDFVKDNSANKKERLDLAFTDLRISNRNSISMANLMPVYMNVGDVGSYESYITAEEGLF